MMKGLMKITRALVTITVISMLHLLVGAGCTGWSRTDSKVDLNREPVEVNMLPQMTKTDMLFQLASIGDLTGYWLPFKNLLMGDGDIDVNAKDEYGNTLLMLASFQSDPDIAAFLIAKGADVNARDESGQTPLHCVASSGYVQFAQTLLDNGAKVNAQETNGYTPLYWAESKEMVKLLLKNGAKVNIRNAGGWTPLHIALMSPNHAKLEVVELLIQYGADVNAINLYGREWESTHDSNPFVSRKTYWGDTPLEIAVNKNYPDIVDLLKKHGATN